MNHHSSDDHAAGAATPEKARHGGLRAVLLSFPVFMGAGRSADRRAISRDEIVRLLTALFFLSGVSSLIFETVFVRLLTYTFGNTAYAVSTVLATFLGGLALGAVVFGRWIDARPASLRVYGVLELLVGVVCLLIPTSFGLVTQAYVSICQRLQLGTGGLTATRFALAAVPILIPTILMGGTLPVVARYLGSAGRDFRSELDRLYAFNTLGGATGVLLSTYFLMPSFGIWGTIAAACATNLSIFLCVMAACSRSLPLAPPDALPPPPSSATASFMTGHSGLLLAGSFLTGAAALAYEVVWTHALSFLIGNTVYAFGIMLFAVLCGLGWGARIVERRLRQPALWPASLALSQALLGAVVFITLPLWTRIPWFFGQGVSGAWNWDLRVLAVLLIGRITYVYWWKNRQGARGRVLPWYRAYEPHMEALLFALVFVGIAPLLWKYNTTWFVAGELLRFLCTFAMLIVPALLLGLTFPLLLNLHSDSSRQVGTKVGSIYAANTFGTILGSLLTGFLLIPRLGSNATLRSCAAVNVLLGLGFALGLLRISPARKRALTLGAAAAAGLFMFAHSSWDMKHVTGTYAYFNAGWVGEQVLFLKEDVQGGLTSVVQAGNIRTLLSNGKFQGDNWEGVQSQTRFALIPALFTRQFDRALVIGLGTGGTLHAVARFPFRRIDAVEIAPQVVEAAREWFGDVNGGVLDRDPRVALSITDGRNFLLLSRQQYDMITIEVTALWISGESDLYNKEFYELCRSHLGTAGVLQQWVALHHLRSQDLLVILSTAAQVFSHVAFFCGSGQDHGLLIASSSPLECDYRRITGFDQDPGVRQELNAIGVPSAWSLLGEIVLFDRSFQQAVSLLPKLTGLRPDFASTDYEPYLEYQAPKGITVPYDTATANFQFLEKFRSPGLPPELVIHQMPSDNEKNLVLGYVAETQGDRRGALEYFSQVHGSVSGQARVEMNRLSVPMAHGVN